MLSYGEAMSEAAADITGMNAIESRLREALDRSDAMLAATVPVLHHLLADDDSGLFGDAVVARIRGMTDDVARQLLDRFGAAEKPGAHDPILIAELTTTISADRAFLGHVHAVALEWQMTELLQDRQALDPVLSPLLQALIGSDDDTTAALAMKLLAAQARFGQAQRRMRLPLTELPGDLLHGVLVALRALAGTEPEADARAAAAEAAIRADYDEARSRLGLLSRIVSGMGGGAIAALSLRHAGTAIFLSALALASRQDRDLATLAVSERQQLRLALILCAAGLKPAAIEEQLLAIDPDAVLPQEIARLAADRAAALLAGGG